MALKKVSMRLPEELIEKMDAKAKVCGITFSELVRQSLQKSKVIIWDELTRQDRLEIIRLLSKNGNNLNQIAHQLNTLALCEELTYDNAIHFLRILETIEFQQHVFLERFKIAH